VCKDNGWRLHRAELLPYQWVEKQQDHQANNQSPKNEQYGIQGFAIVLFLVSEIQHCSRRQTSQQRQG
jgi:hypothetical protein